MLRVAHGIIVLAIATSATSRSAVIGENVTVAPESSLPLPARYFHPTGNGPFPGILVLHGSGGLWTNDNPAGNVMTQHFEDWAQELTTLGYASLFVDSYTPRGIVEFPSRRPAEDPAIDDSTCSPAYERPKDAFKALAYLQSRADIIPDKIGLLAFSQGAETALSTLLSPSVTRSTWTMSYLKLDGSTETRTYPAPPRVAVGSGAAPGFAVAAIYYPGCGFYGYFGASSATGSNLYMPYVPTIIHHGANDPLYSTDLTPEKLVLKSASQATARGLNYNPLQLRIYTGATHSFDEATLDLDPSLDSPNAAARRQAHTITLQWFDAFLKPPRVTISAAPSLTLKWNAGAGVLYRVLAGNDPANATTVTATQQTVSTDQGFQFPILNSTSAQFFQIQATLPGPQ